MKGKRKTLALILAALLLSLSLLAGCGGTSPEDGSLPEDQAGTTQESFEASDDSSEVTKDATVLKEDGVYTSKEEVALYLETYKKLPGNYITKRQAQKLGWDGGSLEPYAPGKCIGGDRFGNYEGVLPENVSYRECDIDTLGRKNRGSKRIVYSQDWKIYYTEDHYQSFERLY